MIPQEWVGERVEVELIRPGVTSSQEPALIGTTHWGTLEAVGDLGISASLSVSALPRSKTRRRFYPWSAVLSIDLSR